MLNVKIASLEAKVARLEKQLLKMASKPSPLTSEGFLGLLKFVETEAKKDFHFPIVSKEVIDDKYPSESYRGMITLEKGKHQFGILVRVEGNHGKVTVSYTVEGIDKNKPDFESAGGEASFNILPNGKVVFIHSLNDFFKDTVNERNRRDAHLVKYYRTPNEDYALDDDDY